MKNSEDRNYVPTGSDHTSSIIYNGEEKIGLIPYHVF